MNPEEEMYLTAEQWGFPKEWHAFTVQHREFLERFPRLEDLLRRTLVRQVSDSPPGPFVVLMLGCLAAEDLREILLLCGNGCGIAALRLLRSLYERAVTIAYIARNQSEAGRFMNFHHYQFGKILKRVEGEGQLTKYFDPADVPVRKELFARVRTSFRGRKCPACKKAPMDSWSRLDLPSMAHHASDELSAVLVDYYLLPSLHVHSSVTGIFHRIKRGERGENVFEPGPQPRHVGLALRGAHYIMLVLLGVENSFFSLQFEPELQRLWEDFSNVWGNDERQ